MPSDESRPESRDVALTFDVPTLTSTQLIDTIRSIEGVAKAVAGSIAPMLKIDWEVRSITMASPLSMVFSPTARELPPNGLVDATSRGVVEGLAKLQRGEDPPPYFTTKALKDARRLAHIASGPDRRMSIARGGDQTEISANLQRNVDRILESVHQEGGTVEGHLDVINIHGPNHYFAVYDDLTGDRIECRFGPAVPLAKIASAVGKRVSVEGEISYRRSGDITQVAADKLIVFPDDSELPTARDVLGILR